MYHLKNDEIVLPIRRRPSATSLRERFLDPSDSPLRSDLSRSKLSQLGRQKPWPKQQLGTSSRSPQQGFATSEFRVHNERAAYAANFDTYQNIQSANATLRFEEPQDSLFRGKKINLSDYKERQLKKFDLRQAQRLPTTSSHVPSPDKDMEEEEMDRVQMTDDTTHSKEGVPLDSNSRKKRKDYPSSWGSPSSTTKMKKRVLATFDGERRLWKDDMMLDTDDEIRTKSGTEKDYVTDLDVQTMRRADVLYDAIEKIKGPRISDDLTELDPKKRMDLAWLERVLTLLRKKYPNDSFEGTMSSYSFDAITKLPCPRPQPGQSSEGIKYMYLPRIRCHDCPGKLYALGPGDNFVVHLRNRQHKERASRRIWGGSPPMTPSKSDFYI
jgi:hypothetical protein